MFDFQEIDKKLRTLDSRVNWLEGSMEEKHEAHLNYKEKLEMLYDAFEKLKLQLSKQKEPEKKIK